MQSILLLLFIFKVKFVFLNCRTQTSIPQPLPVEDDEHVVQLDNEDSESRYDMSVFIFIIMCFNRVAKCELGEKMIVCGRAARWWDEQIKDKINAIRQVYKRLLMVGKICGVSIVDYGKRSNY